MQIDVVSDTVCPWCFIGKRKLERAMAMRPDLEFDIRWRAYRLDPMVPAEGVDRKEYLRAKFGDNPRSKAMGEAIREAGANEGIAFAFDKIEKTPNTLDSHRLIRWAGSAGMQNAVVERLFRAYFEEGRDLGSRGFLIQASEECGMDAALVSDLLGNGADREIVENEDALAHQMGISGVPTFIFANKFMISGAQDPEILVRIIDKAQQASD
ncbi:MAG: disulfide bond formation protein DsbA [Alphaproteobacteria bacterium]|nr:disulfide bond formation protein DsbA [Alphaproteobacteria bacterium]